MEIALAGPLGLRRYPRLPGQLKPSCGFIFKLGTVVDKPFRLLKSILLQNTSRRWIAFQASRMNDLQVEFIERVV